MNKHIMKRLAVVMVPVLSMGLYSVVAAAEEIVVVVNPKNPTATITTDQVEQVFLGKATSLPGGGAANPIDQSDGSSLRDDFYQKATGKSSSQVKAVWSRLVFSGKGTPPKVLASSGDVKKLVASDLSAIGYIEKSAVDGTVKVVLSLP